MKRGFIGVVLVIAWAWGCISLAAAEDTIVVLRTGEVVRGVVVKEGTAYKVTSEVLGPLTIQETDVTSVHAVTDAENEWQQRKDQLMSDPAAMTSIQGIAKDKEVMDFVMDPEIQKALKNQDIEALKNNPKFIQFANNPEVQKLAQDMIAKEKQ